MKFVLIFYTTVALALSEGLLLQIREKLKLTRKICAETTNVSSEQMEQILNYNYPDSIEVHHYMKCVFENIEVWNATHGFRSDLIGDMMEGHKYRNEILTAIDYCNNKCKSNDASYWIYKTVECAMNGTMGKQIKHLLQNEFGEDTFSSAAPASGHAQKERYPPTGLFGSLGESAPAGLFNHTDEPGYDGVLFVEGNVFITAVAGDSENLPSDLTEYFREICNKLGPAPAAAPVYTLAPIPERYPFVEYAAPAGEPAPAAEPAPAPEDEPSSGALDYPTFYSRPLDMEEPVSLGKPRPADGPAPSLVYAAPAGEPAPAAEPAPAPEGGSSPGALDYSTFSGRPLDIEEPVPLGKPRPADGPAPSLVYASSSKLTNLHPPTLQAGQPSPAGEHVSAAESIDS